MCCLFTTLVLLGPRVRRRDLVAGPAVRSQAAFNNSWLWRCSSSSLSLANADVRDRCTGGIIGFDSGFGWAPGR